MKEWMEFAEEIERAMIEHNLSVAEAVMYVDSQSVTQDGERVTKTPELLNDTREQLERDIDAWLDMWTAWSIPKRTLKLAVIEWLDRQEAITTRQLSDRQIMQECKDWERWCKDAERKCSELQAELEKQTADYADVIAAQIKQLRDASERNGELRTALDIAGAKLEGKPECELCDRATLLSEIEGLTAERDRYRELASELLDAAHNMQLIADRGLA